MDTHAATTFSSHTPTPSFVSVKKVVKRDGRVVDFDLQRIVRAIAAAGKATQEFDVDVAMSLALKVLDKLCGLGKDVVHIETIQDIVEETLMDSPYKRTARAYIVYREKRREARELARQGIVELVDAYLSQKDWRVKENANMSFSLQGLNFYISSEVSRTWWLTKGYPEEVSRAHIEGDLHIHDLGMIAPYCVGWSLHDLLLKGFGGVPTKIQSAPPTHLQSALGQMVNFLYTLQGESAGAQAFSDVDTLLAPFVAYDRLDYDELKRLIRGWVFNLNVPTRVGFQTPFTNITLNVGSHPVLDKMNVIIGGKEMPHTYGEFARERELICKAFFEVMSEGDAKGRIFTFPIPTLNVTLDFPWDSEAGKAICEATAKYGVPYFANFINSDLEPTDVTSMCCRLRLDRRELRSKGGGLFGANPLTGSIGVVTLNLPRLGYISKSEDELFERLERLLEIAKTSLEIKRKIIERFTEDDLYPYSKFYLSEVKRCQGRYWANHFSTIGVVGMHEMCLNFLGVGIDDPAGKEFAIKVLKFIRGKLEEFQEETGNLYNLEATPAESTSYRLAKLDKKKWDDIKVSGNGTPYYTNSCWLPVSAMDDPFYVLSHQDDLQVLFTGGTVVHIFLGEDIHDPQIVKHFVVGAFSNFKLPYLSITPTFSICPNCGRHSGEYPVCPKCGASCEVYSRVVGYFRPTHLWNEGKQAEWVERKKLSPKVLTRAF